MKSGLANHDAHTPGSQASVFLEQAFAPGEMDQTSHPNPASSSAREGKFKKVKMPERSIESLLKRAVVEGPDVVKIDVEGGEIAVFEGAKETFSKFRPSIIFEADENLFRF